MCFIEAGMIDESSEAGEETNKIKFGSLNKKKEGTNKFRENPWIVSTIVLGIVLILVVIFGGVGYQGTSGNVISNQEAADNLVSFVKSQSQVVGAGDDIQVVSSEREGELYKVTLNFQGQDVPVYVSLDGKYLIADVIPLDPSLLPSLPSGGSGDGTGVGGAGSTGSSVVEVEIGDSPSNGDANAPVTIVEFSDYECPFCGRFFLETLPLIEEKYIKTGKARLVYKDFPLNSIHLNAQKAAEAARCVEEQKKDEGYFKMHDLLFKNQQELSVENYKKWARSLGVVGTKFDKCLEDGKFEGAVLNDFVYGQSLGVTGTPAFFINGKLISGAQPYSVFEQMIDAALESS